MAGASLKHAAQGRTLRHGHSISLGLVAAAAMAITPATAAAAPSWLIDELNTGTTDAKTWIVEPGQLRLKPPKSTNFEGASVADGWPSTPWPGGGYANDGGGFSTINGAHVAAAPVSSGVMEFRATFANTASQHVGYGDFTNGPWAMFSTSSGSSVGLFARTRTEAGAVANVPITGVNPEAAHGYRIDWTAAGVKFYVDGVLRATAGPIASSMRPGASDPVSDAVTLKVDWIGVTPYPASGTFVSSVLEAADPRAVWAKLSPVSGTTFATRTGRTATPADGTWSQFRALGARNMILSPPRRNIQYRATLTTSDSRSSPVLDSVAMTYEIDTTPPAIAKIKGVKVSGAAAAVRFSASDADFAGFECRLDRRPFAACRSPKRFAGLALGRHRASVRVLDRVGNTGQVMSRRFKIRSTDGLAPKVRIASSPMRASLDGSVRIGVRCPAGEVSCKVRLKLQRGGESVARKVASIRGGRTRRLKLVLSEAARLRLAERGRLKVVAVARAKDAAGNRRRVTRSITLLAPSS